MPQVHLCLHMVNLARAEVSDDCVQMILTGYLLRRELGIEDDGEVDLFCIFLQCDE